MTTPAERAKQLTEAHWNGYVKPTLETHFLRPSETRHDEDAEIYSWRDVMRIAEHHYCTSGIHFYVHAVEDCRNGMFDTPPHDGEGSDLYLHGNQCPSCQQYEKGCAGGYHMSNKGRCEGFISAALDPVKIDLCPSCAKDPDCFGQQQPVTQGKCEGYIPALRERMLDAKGGTDIFQLAETAIRALCYTRDYVGPDRLPAVAGWEWYDACKKLLPFLPNGSMWADEFKLRTETVPMAKQDAPKTAEPATAHTDPALNCKDCVSGACMGAGLNVTMDHGCEMMKPKEASL